MVIDYSFSFIELEYFLMIMMRVCSFIFVAPFFGMNNTPRRVKAALGIFISLIMYSLDIPHEQLQYQSMVGYLVLTFKEILTGLLIGFSAHICTMVTSFAGQVVDMNIGLSMMSMLDPSTRENVTITGTYYQYATMLMLLISGMYQYLLRALFDTYRIIPIGKAVLHGDDLINSAVLFLSEYLIMGFRICLPVFTVIMILNTVLGILAKVAPQMNMFAVGIQIKILVGLVVMFITVAMLPGVANFVFSQIRVLLTRTVQYITPV